MILKNKVALITGAGRGIGKETVIRLAKDGADVILVSRSELELKKVRKITDSYKVRSLIIAADVSIEEEVKKIFEKIRAEFGRVDIVVTAAGIHLRKAVIDISAAEWDLVLAINLKGTFLCCREAAKMMIDQNYGKIIIVSSKIAKLGVGDQSAYCASKHGLIGLTESLQDELKNYDINVNAVLPAGVDTRMVEDTFPEIDRSLLLKPQQVSEVITFLASDRASGVKGASYEVWGGQNYRPNFMQQVKNKNR
jgi:NAD(P)-dependent dehydrogenase (short-subunit alcohol dehydrogenase family)